ncbi:winged helix-turn-helix domain-containing protein [Actinosynnema pretiosum subsp. pretiosum]
MRIVFTTDDLVGTVVASGSEPLWDVVLACRRLHDRDRPAAFRRWAAETRARLRPGDRDLAVLRALTPAPDLLTPPEQAHGLEAALDAVRATPPRRAGAELARLRLPEPVTRGGTGVLGELAECLRRLHGKLVEPHAGVVAESAAADRARRARDLVDGGVHALLSGLGPHVRWRPPVLEVAHRAEREVRLAGRGLRLVPSYFCRTPATLADPDLPPVLVHPLDEGDRWSGGAAPGLDALLGPTRCAVLECARAGASTTELARRVGTSAASASRHTAVLREAGLLRTSRQRGQSLHTATALGRSLLAAAGERGQRGA